MSKPIFDDIFRFSGRRNRKSYILYSLVLFCFLAVVWGLAFALFANNEYTMLVIAGVLSLAAAISGWAVGAQRCRDFGWTGWAILLTVVPYIGWLFAVVIIFIPGTLGPNRYGPDPLGT